MTHCHSPQKFTKNAIKMATNERETVTDIIANTVTTTSSAAPSAATDCMIQVVEITAKIRVKDIEPFQVDRRNPNSLEDYMYDFENQLL